MNTTLRPELTPLPDRMKELPLDERGYPVPWFVAWIDGVPEFRCMDPQKWMRAIKERLCWVCGQKLGAYLCFVLGPMCGITRSTSEPPVHLECGRWSARNCPFLTRPNMERREHDKLVEEQGVQSPGGKAILRNPGVALLWVTQTYQVFKPPSGVGYLMTVGPAIEVEWWAQGKPATYWQVEESVMSGLPILEEDARDESEAALKGLYMELDRLKQLYPK